jgi:hypothetical protein
MNYFIYDNWQAKDRKGAIIHKWNCGHCHMGYGKLRSANKGENGVWIGPFDELQFARDYFQMKFNSAPIECSCIK